MTWTSHHRSTVISKAVAFVTSAQAHAYFHPSYGTRNMDKKNCGTSLELEDEVWVEHRMKEFERSRCISRVLSVDREDVVAAGENYASQLHRLKLRVVLHSGDIEERSYILKAIPPTPERKKAIKKIGAFNKEANMLTKVLPEMELLLLEKEPTADLMWPRCFGVKGNAEAILIEDLKALNYKNADRQKGLNVEECSLAVEYLAKNHALAAVLIEREEINPDEYLDSPDKDIIDHMEIRARAGLEELANLIEDHWDKKWSEYPEKLRNLKNHAGRYLECLNPKGKKFCTITHGDCWTNNIMFKYEQNNQPQSLRFIDFQEPYYRSSSTDFQYLICTSLQAELRTEWKPKLFQLYCDSLIESLKLYGYGSPLPTKADLEEDLKSISYFKFSTIVFLMPMAFRPSSSEPLDMEDMSKMLSEKKPVKIKLFDPSWTIIMDCLEKALIEATENGIFN